MRKLSGEIVSMVLIGGLLITSIVSIVTASFLQSHKTTYESKAKLLDPTDIPTPVAKGDEVPPSKVPTRTATAKPTTAPTGASSCKSGFYRNLGSCTGPCGANNCTECTRYGVGGYYECTNLPDKKDSAKNNTCGSKSTHYLQSGCESVASCVSHSCSQCYDNGNPRWYCDIGPTPVKTSGGVDSHICNLKGVKCPEGWECKGPFVPYGYGAKYCTEKGKPSPSAWCEEKLIHELGCGHSLCGAGQIAEEWVLSNCGKQIKCKTDSSCAGIATPTPDYIHDAAIKCEGNKIVKNGITLETCSYGCVSNNEGTYCKQPTPIPTKTVTQTTTLTPPTPSSLTPPIPSSIAPTQEQTNYGTNLGIGEVCSSNNQCRSGKCDTALEYDDGEFHCVYTQTQANMQLGALTTVAILGPILIPYIPALTTAATAEPATAAIAAATTKILPTVWKPLPNSLREVPLGMTNAVENLTKAAGFSVKASGYNAAGKILEGLSKGLGFLTKLITP